MTCSDCRKYPRCMERTREYVCREFEYYERNNDTNKIVRRIDKTEPGMQLTRRRAESDQNDMRSEHSHLDNCRVEFAGGIRK